MLGSQKERQQALAEATDRLLELAKQMFGTTTLTTAQWQEVLDKDKEQT